jgi:hypothetical protein
VSLPEPSATPPPAASATVVVPSVEDRLDAMIAEGWRQRSAGDLAASRATFAAAKAILPPGAPMEGAGSFLEVQAPDGIAHVVARGDAIVMRGGSGPTEASVLVDPASGEVARWFGRALALAAGKEHALLLRDGDPDKHTGKLTMVDLKTGLESVPVVVSTEAPIGWGRDVVVATGGQSIAFTGEDGSGVIHFVRDWSDAWSTGPGDPDKGDRGMVEVVDFSPDGNVAFVVPEMVTSRGPQPQSADLTGVDGSTTYSVAMPEPVDPFFPGRIPPSQTEPMHAFSPDSRLVLIENRKKGVFELVDAATGSVLGSSKACRNATVATFAADSQHVVVVETESITKSHACAFDVPSLRVAAQATWPGPPQSLVRMGIRMLVDPGRETLLFDPATLRTVGRTRGSMRMSGRDRALVVRSCDPKAPKPLPDCGALLEVTPDAVRVVRTFPRESPAPPEIAALPQNAGERLCHAGRWVFPGEACGR